MAHERWTTQQVRRRWIVLKHFVVGTTFVLENDAGNTKKFRSEKAAEHAAGKLNNNRATDT